MTGSSVLPTMWTLERQVVKNLYGVQQPYSTFSSPSLLRLSCAKSARRQTWPSPRRVGRICAGLSSGERNVERSRGNLQRSSGNGGKLEGAEFDPLNLKNEVEMERADSGNASSSSDMPFTLFSIAPMMVYPLIAEGPGYSQASYYTSLGLFVISVPGIWSLVKRSTKSKIVKKTFELPGPNGPEGKAPNQIAGEITSSLTRNNFAVKDRGDTVTFEGQMVPSRGQAAFLSFCTAVSLGCVALVLSITAPAIGEKWYFLTVLSPLAGFYYWTRASRKEQIKVKMVVADDESSTDVIIQGDDEQIDRLRRELGLMEKGMVYVKGLLER
ncbi:unnamed protein product [Calypogeia fissa]